MYTSMIQPTPVFVPQGSSSTLAYMEDLARGSRDLPALVFYSLIGASTPWLEAPPGNDVCRMVPGNMTSVEDFRSNVLQVPQTNALLESTIHVFLSLLFFKYICCI